MTAVLPLMRVNERLFEDACHEGNYALVGILRDARAQERQTTNRERTFDSARAKPASP